MKRQLAALVPSSAWHKIKLWHGLLIVSLLLTACQRVFAPPSLTPTAVATSTLAPTKAPIKASASPAPATATTSSAAAPAQTSGVAIITELVKGVLKQPAPDASWVDALKGDALAVSGKIQTDHTGKATLQFSEGVIVRVASDTFFELKDAGDKSRRLRLDFGTLFIWLKGALGQSVEVETPVGVGSVRGSLVRVDYDPVSGATIVTCLETTDRCIFTNADTNTELVMLSGQRGIIIQGQLVGLVELMSYEDVQDFLAEFPEAAAVIPTVFPSGTPTAGPTRTPIPGAVTLPTATNTPTSTTVVIVIPPTATFTETATVIPSATLAPSPTNTCVPSTLPCP